MRISDWSSDVCSSDLAENTPPRACFDFADPLSGARDVRFEDFVRIEPETRVSAEASGESLCLAGFEHGKTYEVELREGLPGADGLTLKTTERQTVRIGHRAPSVAFPGSTFILPPVGEGLPETGSASRWARGGQDV